MMANFQFQLLMLSPNLLKSQSPVGVGGGLHDSQLPTFDDESKSAKIPKSLYGGGVHDGQLPTFDAESKSAKIPKSGGGGGASWLTSNFRC